MEFQEFWKNYNRMCNSKSYCYQCKLHDLNDDVSKARCIVACAEHQKEAEQIVEKWAKEHPVMTNGQKYQEIMKSTFGEAYPNGVMGLNSSGGEHGIQYTNDWWNAEYQPPKGEEG